MKLNMWIYGANAVFDFLAGTARAATGQDCVMFFVAGGAWTCAFLAELQLFRYRNS